jgi:hypothetical protein
MAAKVKPVQPTEIKDKKIAFRVIKQTRQNHQEKQEIDCML